SPPGKGEPRSAGTATEGADRRSTRGISPPKGAVLTHRSSPPGKNAASKNGERADRFPTFAPDCRNAKLWNITSPLAVAGHGGRGFEPRGRACVGEPSSLPYPCEGALAEPLVDV